jgi:hypothetical protein
MIAVALSVATSGTSVWRRSREDPESYGELAEFWAWP